MGGRLVKVSSAFLNEISSNYHQFCQTSKCLWIIQPRSLVEIIFQPTTTKNWCWSSCVMVLRLMEKLFPFALNLFKIARNIKSITRCIKLLRNYFLESFRGNLRMSSTVKGYHQHCEGIPSALQRAIISTVGDIIKYCWGISSVMWGISSVMWGISSVL